MGIIILIIIYTLFIYGIRIVNKKNISVKFVSIAIFFLIIQLFSVLDDPNIHYEGLDISKFFHRFYFYIAFVFYYIGYFIWSVIALLIIYIPIINNRKNKTN